MIFKFKDIIEEIKDFNTDLQYGLDDIVGVTIEKGLISTVANLTQTSLEKFYLVGKDDFVYNPRTHGVRLGMGFNESDKTYITTWNNIAFRVKDKNIVLPKFLWLYFLRPEWDRQANYLAWGSSTIVFAWKDFLEIAINIPSIEEQRRIVNEYQTVERRIRNNEALIQKLEETAQAIYYHTFVEGIDEENLPSGWKKGVLGDIATFSNGKTLEPNGTLYPVYGGNGIVGYNDDFNAENVIVIGRVGINCGCLYYQENKCWVNDNAMKGVSKVKANRYLLYLMKTLELNRQSEGSSQPLMTQTILNNIEILIPDYSRIKDFEYKVSKLTDYILNIKQENTHLRTLLTLLTSKLS